jgi:Putative transposase/Transposase zinc-binding domain
MKRPTLEVADIIRCAGKGFIERNRPHLGWQQLKVLRAIKHCRTAALGGHLDQCSRCGHRAISFFSCRNRHCPKCQTNARNKWLAARSHELLGVPYFHVVFTLPHELSALALQNKRAVYDLLFQASAATLLEVAADPKHLGAAIGFLSVLHTWGQNLQAHPHVHCVIPAGGLSPDHSRWIHTSHHFFLPVKVLSRVFRGKFVAGLKCLYRRKKLGFHGNLKYLSQPIPFRAFLRQLFRQDWVVYAKPPFGGPEYVLQYLARYTHRVAISNHRLISLADGKVTFRWKDYAHGNKKRKMTITTDEFLRRFLLHVLPRGFVRIRHFGFLSARWRREFVPICRQLLAEVHRPRSPTQTVTPPSLATWPCPCCGGAMRIIEKLTAEQIRLRSQQWKNLIDSS